MSRRRRKKENIPAKLVVVAIVAGTVFHLIRHQHWYLLVQGLAMGMMLGGIWLLFFRSTRCGYITYQGKPCRYSSPGELRGCKKYHKGLKFEALLNHMGLRHPRQRMQAVWMKPMRSSTITVEDDNEPPGKLERPLREIVALVATVFSAITSVVMPVIQMVALSDCVSVLDTAVVQCRK